MSLCLFRSRLVFFERESLSPATVITKLNRENVGKRIRRGDCKIFSKILGGDESASKIHFYNLSNKLIYILI